MWKWQMEQKALEADGANAAKIIRGNVQRIGYVRSMCAYLRTNSAPSQSISSPSTLPEGYILLVTIAETHHEYQKSPAKYKTEGKGNEFVLLGSCDAF